MGLNTNVMGLNTKRALQYNTFTTTVAQIPI